MPSGIIVRGVGGSYSVKTEGGIYDCVPKGTFRKIGIVPLVGDLVNIEVVDSAKAKGRIEEILPRKSLLTRPAVANVDQIAVVIAVRSPEPDLELLDKLLIAAELKGIKALICANKIDLDTEGRYREITGVYKKIGYRVVPTSFKTGEGFNELMEAMAGSVTVFAGQSGVGKSTILNTIMGFCIMETSEVSRKIERGRHTTRHAELVELKQGGYVVDTPGFSSFELTDIESMELKTYFPEFNLYESRCRFQGCAHIAEPGCGVKDAVEDGLIDKGRYMRYVRLYNDLKEIESNKWK